MEGLSHGRENQCHGENLTPKNNRLRAASLQEGERGDWQGRNYKGMRTTARPAPPREKKRPQNKGGGGETNHEGRGRKKRVFAPYVEKRLPQNEDADAGFVAIHAFEKS